MKEVLRDTFKKEGQDLTLLTLFEKRKMLKFCKATPLLSHLKHKPPQEI